MHVCRICNGKELFFTKQNKPSNSGGFTWGKARREAITLVSNALDFEKIAPCVAEAEAAVATLPCCTTPRMDFHHDRKEARISEEHPAHMRLLSQAHHLVISRISALPPCQDCPTGQQEVRYRGLSPWKPSLTSPSP